MLNHVTHGTATDAPPLLIAHGLYGSARNWGVIAKRLSQDRQVIAVDMRNHGSSPWFPSHSYPEMANDLAEVLEAFGPADVLGHSMGGKAAMVLALTRPDLVNRLIVADIAPVAYGHSHTMNIDAMMSVDLNKVSRRAEADAQLAKTIDDPMLRSFFTQSLDIKEKTWRLNLETLRQDMPNLVGFPEVTGQYDGPTLFLTGAESDYVRPEHRGLIKSLFPTAVFAKIPGAGHWLHAEKPREFVAAVAAWLSRG